MFSLEKREPAMIGDLSVDVVLESTPTFDSSVTTNPVEKGYNIADHVVREPMKLSLSVVITPTPVSYIWTLGVNQDRLPDAVNKIMRIYQKGEPITITLSDGIYEDMVMTSAPLPRNIQNGNCYVLSLEFVHITTVSPKTEEIPEDNATGDAKGKAGKSDRDAGTASQTEIGTGLTVRNGKNYIAVNTLSVDRKNFGVLTTGEELVATTAAAALFACLRV